MAPSLLDIEIELKPNDGINNAPSATAQNGPYYIVMYEPPPDQISDWVGGVGQGSVSSTGVSTCYHPRPDTKIDMRVI